MKISERIEKLDGYASGWDYMRLCLASGILIFHSVPLTYGSEYRQTMIPWWIEMFIRCLLPMFFCLSGFLVSASLLRTPLPSFIAARFLRIFPALAVEIILSALLLGPMLTTVSLQDYFFSAQFAAYFKSLYGNVQFYLPGMFETNPLPRMVNGALWTVPWELYCYIGLIGLAVFKVVWRWQMMLAAVVVLSAYIHATADFAHFNPVADGRNLILFFLSGVTVFCMRDFIALRFDLFLICAATALLALMTPSAYQLAALPLAYVTAFLGLTSPRKSKLISSGDYSYGIYLYAFPVQQAVALLLPNQLQHWIVNALISMVAVGTLAALSWHLIERRCLAIKRRMFSKEAAASGINRLDDYELNHDGLGKRARRIVANIDGG